MRDVGKAAKDWPQLNFVIYHSAYRYPGGGTAADGLERVRADRAQSPGSATWPISRQKFGVTNVYGDVGQLFAQSVVAEPRLGAALMGILIKGLGARPRLLGHRRDLDRLAAMADRVAAPARDPRGHAEEIRLRSRSARPTARSRPPSSAATTCASTACRSAPTCGDRFAGMKEEYLKNGAARSNLRYGYVRKPEGVA